MRVLYIDVYFLINFTADLLALYFAGKLSSVTGTLLRLVLASLFGALFACIVALFVIDAWIFSSILLLSGALISLIYVKKCSLACRFRLFVTFIITETLIGGAITFLFSVFERYITPLTEFEGGAENRRLLLMSVAVLFSYGALKLTIHVLQGLRGQSCIRLKIELLGKCCEVEGLIDTGNLLKDPITSEPVILVKRKNFDIIGENVKLGYGDTELNMRIRLIPIKTVSGNTLLYGLKTDAVSFIGGERKRYVGAIIALDESPGDYNGYQALVPISIL